MSLCNFPIGASMLECDVGYRRKVIGLDVHVGDISVSQRGFRDDVRFQATVEISSRNHSDLMKAIDRISGRENFYPDEDAIKVDLSQSIKKLQQSMTGAANAFKTAIIESQSKTEQMKRYNFTLTFQNCEGQTKTTSVALIATSLVAANKLFSTLYATGCDNEATAFGTKIRVTSVVEEAILVDEVKAAKK